MFSRKEEPDMKIGERLKLFFAAHWRGFLIFIVPILLLPIILPLPAELWQWCAYCLIIMAVFWVTECIPLPVTSFLPVMIFPITGVMHADGTCSAYINDSVMMFVGSLLLAFSVEQSGLHVRLAYAAIRCIGYSHLKLLMALCTVTTFVSMWITNTAATTMMIPIVFAILKVFENEGLLKIYQTTSDGLQIASDISATYFCAITYSATIGGISTLVGTATNLVFKNLFMTQYPDAPEYLSFPKFSLFAVPYAIILEVLTYFYLTIAFMGLFRPNSEVAKQTKITEKGQNAAKKTIATSWSKLGSITYWEWMVILLFGGAIIAFFCRSPQIFTGWGDSIVNHFGLADDKFIKDSALAMFVVFLMFLLPSQLTILDNFRAKSKEWNTLPASLFLDNYNLGVFKSRVNMYLLVHQDLPKSPIISVLNWKKMNAEMPWSFMFLLGGGTALAKGALTSGLNTKLGEYLNALSGLPNSFIILLVIIVVIFVTNFASNVAVVNVFGPIAMTLAVTVNQNPFYYILAAGYSASFCFMIPVGTPGNLIVQSSAKVTTGQMIKLGLGPTVAAVFVGWLCLMLYGPVVWPVLREQKPDWAK